MGHFILQVITETNNRSFPHLVYANSFREISIKAGQPERLGKRDKESQLKSIIHWGEKWEEEVIGIILYTQQCPLRNDIRDYIL